MEESYFIQIEDEIFGKDRLHKYASEILDAKYEFTDVIDVVNRQGHLTQSQKDTLLSVIQKHQQMFDGTLGKYPHNSFHNDIDPDAKPVYSRPCSIPCIHLNTFNMELEHYVKTGLLAQQNKNEWASQPSSHLKRMVESN
eukprot:4851162-Ditylum_brightwellii.AAC.1